MQVSGGVALYLDGAGNAFVNANLTLNSGNGFKPGGGSWAATSDKRLKENIQPLTGSLEKLLQLNPVTYGWKYETSEPTVGFIAQEVQEVMPNSVVYSKPSENQKPFLEKDDALGIGWQNDLFAYLIGAIKELNLKQVELETKINIQAAYIAALQAKV